MESDETFVHRTSIVFHFGPGEENLPASLAANERNVVKGTFLSRTSMSTPPLERTSGTLSCCGYKISHELFALKSISEVGSSSVPFSRALLQEILTSGRLHTFSGR